MPLITLFLSIIFGVVAFGLILCATEDNYWYWVPAVCFGFWAVVGFLKFLAMC